MATKQQVPVLAARVVEFQDELSKFPNEDAQWAIQNTKEALALWGEAIANRKKSVSPIPRVLSMIISVTIIPPTTEEFVARDNFIVDTSKKAKIKISYLGDNFRKHFLGKIEGPFSGASLVGQKLLQNSVDGPIIAELGGKEKAKTTLFELYAMLIQQESGGSGSLLTNGYANIFYIEDVDGIIWAVLAYWNDVGWDVEASSVDSPDEWDAAYQAFSRNS